MYSIRDPTRVVDLEGFETTTVFSPYYYTDIDHLCTGQVSSGMGASVRRGNATPAENKTF
jgi:hypothetical protein